MLNRGWAGCVVFDPIATDVAAFSQTRLQAAGKRFVDEEQRIRERPAPSMTSVLPVTRPPRNCAKLRPILNGVRYIRGGRSNDERSSSGEFDPGPSRMADVPAAKLRVDDGCLANVLS